MKSKLTKLQNKIIDEIFIGEKTLDEILKQNKIAKKVYMGWLSNEAFREYFQQSMTNEYLSAKVLLSRYSTVAAGKIINLLSSDKPEITLKACTVVLSKDTETDNKKETPVSSEFKNAAVLNDKTAEEMLEILSRENIKLQ